MSSIVQYLSDLHLEFLDHDTKIIRLLHKIVPVAPICVLAGDIGYPFDPHYGVFLAGMSKKFEHVVLIHGNHEYYQAGKNKGKSMKEIIQQTRDICSALPNVHFLHNSWIDLPVGSDGGDVRFIGSVLWSHLTRSDKIVNDAHKIGEFSVERWNGMFHENVAFIDRALIVAKEDKKPVVVVTHHLPSLTFIHPAFQMYSDINHCFASACEELIRSPVVRWIYGHTHLAGSYEWNGVKCITNPIGYPGEVAKPDYSRVVMF